MNIDRGPRRARAVRPASATACEFDLEFCVPSPAPHELLSYTRGKTLYKPCNKKDASVTICSRLNLATVPDSQTAPQSIFDLLSN
jgi:hypothetical protein